jgi:hypothetical protein
VVPVVIWVASDVSVGVSVSGVVVSVSVVVSSRTVVGAVACSDVTTVERALVS